MRKFLTAVMCVGAVSTVAWAFPWDTDMVDAVFKRAYSWKMADLPEGVVSVNHARMPGDHYAPETATMAIPADSDLVEGKRLFENYCTACHGVDGKGNAPIADNSSGRRWPFPPPNLSGVGNITQARTDGWLFYTVRDGIRTMPGYSYAMVDKDIWDLVAYLRTMEDTQYAVPTEVAQ